MAKELLAIFAFCSLCISSAIAQESFDTPLYQSPTVIAALRDMWRTQKNGEVGTESAIVIHSRQSDGTPIIRKAAETHTYEKEQFTLLPNDTAIFHTHPNSCNPRPSSADMQIADKYNVEMYTVSRDGIYFYKKGMSHAVLVMDYPTFIQGKLLASRYGPSCIS